jgi:hypothetical protein
MNRFYGTIRTAVSGVVVNPQDLINPNGRYDSIATDIRIRTWITTQGK